MHKQLEASDNRIGSLLGVVNWADKENNELHELYFPWRDVDVPSEIENTQGPDIQKLKTNPAVLDVLAMYKKS